MNIAFCTTYEVSAQKGGTERITISVSNALREIYGYKCFSLFKFSCPSFEPAYFEGRVQIPMKGTEFFVLKYIQENHIDVLISQGDFEIVSNLRPLLSNINCKLVLVHHFAPGYDVDFFNKPFLLTEIKSAPKLKRRIKSLIHFIFFKFFRNRILKRMKSIYHEAYLASDSVVLLSSGFIEGFKKFGNIEDVSKFSVIPNMLSFDSFLETCQISQKRKRVLIVSRLAEYQKRISLALEIWGKIKHYPESVDWVLDIVGHGENADTYKCIVEEQNIPDVVFHGVQQPESYYVNSSIFMMTSRSEGWGLTLTEAMQFGCVPIAFNSYASVNDIISNHKDGFIIEDNNVDDYVDHIIMLMKDSSLREKMALSAISNCKRFSVSKVAEKWNLLLCNI